MSLPLKEIADLLALLKDGQVEEFEYEDQKYKLRLAFAGARRELALELGDASDGEDIAES